jgi:hypothetical protein
MRKTSATAAVLLVAALIAGCGSGSSSAGSTSASTEGHEPSRAECIDLRETAAGRTPGQEPPEESEATSPGLAKTRRKLAEVEAVRKERAAANVRKHKATCASLGVTQDSPSPGSSEAREAVQQAEAKTEAEERQEYPEEAREVEEQEKSWRRYEITLALVNLGEGNLKEAQAELAEGCPNTPPAEAMAALRNVRYEIDSGSIRGQAAQSEALETVCEGEG